MHYFSSHNPTDQTQTKSVSIRGREYTVEVAANVFSAHRLDLGTQVLLKAVPDPDKNVAVAVDIGCGWGPITLGLADACQSVGANASVWAVDVNERALDLTKRNANTAGFSHVSCATPEQVPVDLEVDLIWSNPPIRVGKSELHQILLEWLPRLSANGVAYLVVAKNLGADSLAKWIIAQGFECQKLASKKGYRILQVTRS